MRVLRWHAPCSNLDRVAFSCDSVCRLAVAPRGLPPFQILGEWVGLRPGRNRVRLELERPGLQLPRRTRHRPAEVRRLGDAGQPLTCFCFNAVISILDCRRRLAKRPKPQHGACPRVRGPACPDPAVSYSLHAVCALHQRPRVRRGSGRGPGPAGKGRGESGKWVLRRVSVARTRPACGALLKHA